MTVKREYQLSDRRLGIARVADNPFDVICADCVVYEIRVVSTGETYIGSTLSLRRRLRGHFNCLRNGKHLVRRMQDVFDASGPSAFAVRILHRVVDGERHYRVERKLIGELKPVLNGSGPHIPHVRKGKRYPGHSEKMRAYWRRERGLRVCGGKSKPARPKRKPTR